jgi:hypothetical protein
MNDIVLFWSSAGINKRGIVIVILGCLTTYVEAVRRYSAEDPRLNTDCVVDFFSYLRFRKPIWRPSRVARHPVSRDTFSSGPSESRHCTCTTLWLTQFDPASVFLLAHQPPTRESAVLVTLSMILSMLSIAPLLTPPICSRQQIFIKNSGC